MENTECVICYDEKAVMFCPNCKKSSGTCLSCFDDWNGMNYNNNWNMMDEEDWKPLPCPICKNKMEYSNMTYRFNLKIEEGEFEELSPELNKIIIDNADIFG